MLNFERFNKIYEKQVQKRYPYKRILVTINSYEDMKTVCSYIEKTFNMNVRIPSHNDHDFPNYACIVVDSIYDNLFDSVVGVRFFADNASSTDDIKQFMEIDDDYTYANIEDILDMNNLNLISDMIYFGKRHLSYKDTYKPSVNIYESNINIKYPYKYIMVEVDSMDDIKKVYDYIDKTYNKTSPRSFLNEPISEFKNYVFIPVNKLYKGGQYDLLVYSYKNDEIFNIIKNTGEVNLDDLVKSNNLEKINFLIKNYHSQQVLKNYFTNTEDRLVYENNYVYPYADIVVRVYNNDDIEKIHNYLEKYYGIKGGWRTKPLEISYPNYFFIPTNFTTLEEFQKNALVLSTISSSEENLMRYYDNYHSFNLDDILDINEISSYGNLLRTGKKQSFKSMYINSKKNIYESNTSTVLNAFDLDETLVFNTTFEENIKHLLLEYKTPTEIFFDKINKKNINISKLKYENGRIYFNDPMNNFNIDKYDTDWVRKKDRVYLIQPDEYLLTNESLPIAVNEKLLELYNNSINKCIITARLENSKSILKKRLNELGINEPNYGLFMLNDKYSNKVKFKADTLIKLQKKYNFEVVNYYDDNIKLLKRMKEYFIEKGINADINLFKVTKSDIRRI